MNIIKMTFLSLALLIASPLFSSMPAPAGAKASLYAKASSFAKASADRSEDTIDPDEFEIPEIHLVPIKDAQADLEGAKKDLQSFAKESQNNELIKKIHQTICATTNHWANLCNAEQYLESRRQQGEPQATLDALHNQAQVLKTLHAQSNQQYLDLYDKTNGNHDEVWNLSCLAARQRRYYAAQALVLRSEKEESLQKEQRMQAYIQQQAERISQLEAALQDQQPGADQIEGVPHQLPVSK